MIKFGTDGWRAEIAKDFTFENLGYVALATARYLNAKAGGAPKAVIGYDTRFLSKEFAEYSAAILASEGVEVYLTDNFASTPMTSFHTKEKGADLGVMITASHNPPQYNGYKLKGSFGGPATPDQVAEVEEVLKTIMDNPPEIKPEKLEKYVESGKVHVFDAKTPFLDHIKKQIDLSKIEAMNLKILFDPMFGAGMGLITELIPSADAIHSEFNPAFPEIGHPEPIDSHLEKAIQMIKEGDYNIGLATDGDADRLGVIDDEGNFVNSHQVFMILLKYLHEKRNLSGSVVKTVSLTSMVDKYCKDNGIKLHITPVGFKHTAKIMNEEQVMIGGEESGGLGTALHIPERDGIFNGLLLMEVMAERNKSLKELCDELDKEFGVHRYNRNDIRVSQEEKEQILEFLESEPDKVGQYDVQKIDRTDGFKFIFKDGSWLLIRASGTEPLLRYYAESGSIDKVNNLLEAAKSMHK